MGCFQDNEKTRKYFPAALEYTEKYAKWWMYVIWVHKIFLCFGKIMEF